MTINNLQVLPDIEFKDADKEGGAQRVLISASKSAPMFAMDVNEEECKRYKSNIKRIMYNELFTSNC